MNGIKVNTQTGEIEKIEVEEVIHEEVFLTDEEKIKLYKSHVSESIRKRYSVNEEFSIHRQREKRPEQWQEYFDFCEECKINAKHEIE